jgi:hypothetical protein
MAQSERRPPAEDQDGALGRDLAAAAAGQEGDGGGEQVVVRLLLVASRAGLQRAVGQSTTRISRDLPPAYLQRAGGVVRGGGRRRRRRRGGGAAALAPHHPGLILVAVPLAEILRLRRRCSGLGCAAAAAAAAGGWALFLPGLRSER